MSENEFLKKVQDALHTMPQKMLKIGGVEIPEYMYCGVGEMGFPNEIVNFVLREVILEDNYRGACVLVDMVEELPVLYGHFLKIAKFLDELNAQR